MRLCGYTLAATLALSGAAFAQSAPAKQSNAGDSISQGFNAIGFPFTEHPDYSWVQGTQPTVNSVFLRFQATDPSYVQQPESVTGSELVGGKDNFAVQAARICSQPVRPNRVEVLLGGNDVCNRTPSISADPTANLYSVQTWVNALRLGLDQLASCLPAGAIVQVLSAPRVDYVYSLGWTKNWWCANLLWPVSKPCAVVTNESDAGRREQIGMRINQYNQATADELAAYNANSNGKNPNGIVFVSDWRGSIEDGFQNTSVGTYELTNNDVSDYDCFHPNVSSQTRIACLAWSTHPEGSGTAAACFPATAP